MCTVVFIPKEGKYCMASLRDEDPCRVNASIPVLAISDQQKFLAPIDPKGGGTWVGANEGGSVIILLNGGFVNHIKKELYARSRGQIVNELLSKDYPLAHWSIIDLTNIEPFTLIVFSKGSLKQLVWDGAHKYENEVDATKPQIWSSSTLYDRSQQQIRQILFEQWNIDARIKTKDSLMDFFNSANDTNELIFIKDRTDIKTQSYTFIDIIPALEISITYQDLNTQQITKISISNN